MERLEETTRKNSRKKKLKNAVLSSIKVAGLLSVALLAPNALQVFGKKGLLTQKEEDSVRSVRNRLIKQGLIEYSGKNLALTAKGVAFINKLEERNFHITKPRKWDKKWRIIIFDIKEGRKTTREKLRRTLIQIGFKKLQNSVWIFPYDCEDLVTLLKADFKIGKEVLYIIAEHIEYDKRLKALFSLG